MTGTEIDTPDSTFSQQLGNINLHIEKLLPLHIELRTSTEKKIMEILDLLKSQQNITDNDRDIIMHAIDACKCKQYTATRITSYFQRTVIKTTHT
jgi:hypothetical protein